MLYIFHKLERLYDVGNAQFDDFLINFRKSKVFGNQILHFVRHNNL